MFLNYIGFIVFNRIFGNRIYGIVKGIVKYIFSRNVVFLEIKCKFLNVIKNIYILLFF